MFKKILAIISTVTVLSFAGCGAQKNNNISKGVLQRVNIVE